MRSYICVIAAASLLGCATAYQAQGLSGGFTETQLAENVWRVSFQGNGYTRRDRAEDLALLRSAELTLQSGYTHFGLADSRTNNDVSAFTTPATYRTTGSATVSGNNIYGSSTTRQIGGDTMFINKPSTTNTVVMFKGAPEQRGTVFDAQFICRSLGAKYEVSCKQGKP
jgi:hypothetical protein